MIKKIFIFVGLIIIITILINYMRIKNLNIEIPSFSFITKEENNKVIFYNFKKIQKLDDDKNKYINKLFFCYDESYFYDKDKNITIKKYEVINNKIINKIIIEYTKENLCEKEFILDVEWYKELVNKAKVSEIIIEKCNEKCVSKKLNNFNEIYKHFFDSKLVRIENNKRVSLKGEYILKIYYKLNNMNYVLEVFNENELYLVFNLIDANDASKNAIYLDEGKKLETLYNK